MPRLARVSLVVRYVIGVIVAYYLTTYIDKSMEPGASKWFVEFMTVGIMVGLMNGNLLPDLEGKKKSDSNTPPSSDSNK